jgi:drug/metabolite transporter (DMT)-like permease
LQELADDAHAVRVPNVVVHNQPNRFVLSTKLGIETWSALMAGRLYLWGASLGVLASFGGAWAWNIATRNLPVVLAAQLIVSETAFGAILGLIARHQAPTLEEAIGLAALIVGVVGAVHVFRRPQELCLQISEPKIAVS